MAMPVDKFIEMTTAPYRDRFGDECISRAGRYRGHKQHALAQDDSEARDWLKKFPPGHDD
jgi:hypothetical protein